MKWVSKGNKKKYSIKRFFNSFIYAFNGIKSACKTEQNFLFDIIFGISDPGDRMGCAHAFCKIAAQHIGFIRIGDSNNKLGFAYAGFLQDLAVRSAAAQPRRRAKQTARR